MFSRPRTLSKLCQADGVDDGSFSVTFLLHIVMTLSYLQHWNSYLLTLTLIFQDLLHFFKSTAPHYMLWVRRCKFLLKRHLIIL